MHIARLFNTVSHLQWKQVYYQLWYRLKRPFVNINGYKQLLRSEFRGIANTEPGCFVFANRYLGNGAFSFLNKEFRFGQKIDWNFGQYGKLWNYNLQYFDYIHDESIPTREKIEWMEDFSAQLFEGKIAAEPYPVSLRLVNWLVFLGQHRIESPIVSKAIKLQADYLRHNLEFHIMANHLLENYFALFVVAIAFRNDELYRQAESGLRTCLDEQVLRDGAHYECSPMYHCILLSRLLLLVDLLKHNEWPDSKPAYLQSKASAMLGWLKEFCWSNGEYAHVNDATGNIAPSPKALFEIAARLSIPVTTTNLSDSGYRKLNNSQFEVLVDAGNIMPGYQPGHSHSDMLNVCLIHKGNPVLIDTGISTYEAGERRYEERSTAAHNTVVVDDKDQSEVWSSFRVGKRANCTMLKDEANDIEAMHDGYRQNLGLTHKRNVILKNRQVSIEDEIVRKSGSSNPNIKALFHFQAGIELLPIGDNKFSIGNDLVLHLLGDCKSEITEYSQATGFNKLEKARKLAVSFNEKLVSVFESI